jgi:hypothetical protein
MQAVSAKEGSAFTLNLSADVEKQIHASADPIRTMSARINRELKRLGIHSAPYAFVFETTDLGRLHIHGVIVADDNLENLKEALMCAGGQIVGRARSRQVKLEQLYDAAGWLTYCQKNQGSTGKIVQGDRLWFVSRELKAIAKEKHAMAVKFAVAVATTGSNRLHRSVRVAQITFASRTARPRAGMRPTKRTSHGHGLVLRAGKHELAGCASADARALKNDNSFGIKNCR